MKERIRELAKKTGHIWHASGDPQIYEFTPEKLEKFAELIIQECAGVAEVSMPVNSYPDDRLKVKNSVLEHFGVKD